MLGTFEKILWGLVLLLFIVSAIRTLRMLRRARRRQTGWMDAAEKREWERKRTKDAEYLRQSKGG